MLYFATIVHGHYSWQRCSVVYLFCQLWGTLNNMQAPADKASSMSTERRYLNEVLWCISLWMWVHKHELRWHVCTVFYCSSSGPPLPPVLLKTPRPSRLYDDSAPASRRRRPCSFCLPHPFLARCVLPVPRAFLAALSSSAKGTRGARTSGNCCNCEAEDGVFRLGAAVPLSPDWTTSGVC